MASVAALAALNLQQTPAGVAHVALQWVWLKLWLDHQQTLGEVTPLAKVSFVAGKHRQAPYWATLVTSVPLG